MYRSTCALYKKMCKTALSSNCVHFTDYIDKRLRFMLFAIHNFFRVS